MADASVDVVFFLEVIFFLPNYEAVLTHIVRVLKPGGFLMASFRSQYFDVLFSLKHGMWDSLNVLLNQRGGRLWGKDIFFNWHTADEIAEILENKYALQLLELRGIGCCSGIAGDPFGDIVSPSKLSKSEFDRLMDVELEMGRHVPDAGRYILTIAQKK